MYPIFQLNSRYTYADIKNMIHFPSHKNDALKILQFNTSQNEINLL